MSRNELVGSEATSMHQERTASSAAAAACRFCGKPLTHTFVDLGMSPLCESFVSATQLNCMEPYYPLHVWVCDGCFLVQLENYVAPEQIFSDYAYFSSYSDSWVEHARQYAEHMKQFLGLGPHSLVMEIASNDGYLLQHFVQMGVPCLGIEPAANVARVAVERGIRTMVSFFGRATAETIARKHGRPQLLLGNNVLAHVPDINDFVAGMKLLLAPGGVITMEFAHLLRLIDGNQYDTIYHEHFSYLSFGTVERIFARHGLALFDVEQLSTHGGSLRVYGCHADEHSRNPSVHVERLRETERTFGLWDVATYARFEERVRSSKRGLLKFLIDARENGKSVVGYGAPGKGNTLLNYCGIRNDLLEFTVDRSPHKHGKFTPGMHIPISPPERLREARPDFILILPWNLKDEIVEQHSYVRQWGGRFVVPIPAVEILDPPP